ncbi:MAG: hypothetical protein E7233_01815 [Lachnospiraceae bacterium]|nr:hypothetical protein [Lachnospiraceae bacterium]
MIVLYAGVPALCLILALVFRNYKKELFKKLDNKEHPLRFLYPASARVYDLFKVIYPSHAHSNVSSLLKQLCVRENVDAEIYLYNIKKIASLTGIFMAVCTVGMLLFISLKKNSIVSYLTRPQYGDANATYKMDVEYDNTAETVELTIDSVKMTEEEILAVFEESYDGVMKAMLNENESPESVSKPLELIDSYENIKIEWEIRDISLINYNGEITDAVEENEFIPMDLYATFTIGDISRVYCFPLMLTGESISAKELLIRNIYESIENDNSAFDPEVSLPDSINGKPLVFREIGSNSDRIFLLFGAAATVFLIFAYDRTLENKLKARQDEMLLDFTEIVFKLSLLYEAGLSIYKAWERIVLEYENSAPQKPHYAYREMRLTLEQIRNGASEAQAYGQFGMRCGLHQYMKLGSILEQNITKGARGMKTLLRQEVRDSFEDRKRLARKKGEEASTKLMIPMVMMLIIVIVIIAFPAVMSIRF